MGPVPAVSVAQADTADLSRGSFNTPTTVCPANVANNNEDRKPRVRVPSRGRGDRPAGLDLVDAPGETITWNCSASRPPDEGLTGEYVGGNSPAAAQYNIIAQYLIGKDPLKREKHWSECKRALRKYDRMGIGPIDIALWDFAGKYYDAPFTTTGNLPRADPTYASTYHGDDAGGLDSPEAFADFAEECRDEGFGGFEIHGWGGGDDARSLDREVEAVHAVGEAVGDEMDLMHDPACERRRSPTRWNWAGRSMNDFAGQGVRRFISTARPQLMAELRHTDSPDRTHPRTGNQSRTAASEATDFLRADPEYDAGITGAIRWPAWPRRSGSTWSSTRPVPPSATASPPAGTRLLRDGAVHPDCQNTRRRCTRRLLRPLDAVDSDGTVCVSDGPERGPAVFDLSVLHRGQKRGRRGRVRHRRGRSRSRGLLRLVRRVEGYAGFGASR